MSAFLTLNSNDSNICLLCEHTIKKKEKTLRCTEENLPVLKEKALEWNVIDIPFNHQYFQFTCVDERLNNLTDTNAKLHASCRASFLFKSEKLLERFGRKALDDTETDTEEVELGPAQTQKRRSNSNLSRAIKCFICNVIRESDDKYYKEGGLGRCSEDRSASKIIDRMKEYLTNINHRYFHSSERLNILLSGNAFDIFAADIYYHQSCYLKFTSIPCDNTKNGNSSEKAIQDEVFNEFLRLIRKNILYKKNAYLLSDLHKEFTQICNDNDIEPYISSTSGLKKRLVKSFPEEISFFPTWKALVVHSSDMNPLQYSVATIRGHGLRDSDIIKSFANLVQRKAKDKHDKHDEDASWPYSPEELIDLIDVGPMKELFNVIYASLGKPLKLTKDGYACIKSNVLATKIWSLASDWESLLTKELTSKQILTGSVLHRMTGRKEVVEVLHKMNNSISYNNVRVQNNAWASMVSTQGGICKGLVRRIPTHLTIDNNDGTEETETGKGTTHDTNRTIFQPVLIGEVLKSDLIDKESNEAIEERLEVPDFEIGVRQNPPLFKSYVDNNETDQLDWCLKRDVIWAIVSDISKRTLDSKIMGSWTCFNKEAVDRNIEKSLMQYLPVIQKPPEYPMCKKFLDDAIDIMNELELGYIFAHSDEQVYAKLAHILWKYKEVYQGIIIIMGGFHQLRVRQKTIYKRHGLKGYKDWWTDANIIAEGSVDQAIEGRHYYRCMRAHKESFVALIQFRVEQITNFYKNLQESLEIKFKDLSRTPSYTNVKDIMEMPEFCSLFNEIFNELEGTENKMTIAYLKDISSLLALVWAVRVGNLECHLQAEREMIKFCFAFDHVNYSRYLSFQQVYLRDLERNNHPAINDIKTRGFGGSLSGSAFSTIHGDLITEVFNGETKRQAGPHRQGFSRNIDAVNTWVRTAHIQAKMRAELKSKIKLSTCSVHKELTNSGRNLFVKHVEQLKTKLYAYNLDPFADNPAKNLVTGEELDVKMCSDLIRAGEIGDEKYKTFVEERLVKGNLNFFTPIKKVNLNTGLKKTKKIPKQVSMIKEDRQAFGMILSKNIRLDDAFNFPLTTVPLSIATPDYQLRQGQKSILRNWLINESKCFISPPKNARWIVDSMALMHTMKPQNDYKTWINKLFNSVFDHVLSPLTIEFINDSYREISTKSGTRDNRGTFSKRVYIQGVAQKMPLGKEWNSFFNSSGNKMDLINLVVNFCKSIDFRKKLENDFEIYITSDELTWKISKNYVDESFVCNHEEADTRMVLHAARLDTPVIIVSKDTDVLILLIYAFNLLRPKNLWLMKIDSQKYVDIGIIVNHLGNDLSKTLPQLHAMTGCDTTSYFYGIGKVSIVRKCLKNPKPLLLLSAIGKNEHLTENEKSNIFSFVKDIFYNGKETETLVDTKIRLYKSMKTKTSLRLPPDPKSLTQAVLRVHHQVFHWLRFNVNVVAELDPSKYGWQIDKHHKTIKPFWYEGNQFPKSLKITETKKMINIDLQSPKRPRIEPDDEIDKDLEYLLQSSSEDESDDALDSDYSI